MTNNKKDYRYPPCPDGGWGWMVVFGSFMIHVIADGVTYSIGQFYYELVKHFGESKTITSMIVSIMNGTTYCIGPIASALTIRYGCRAVTIAGSIFASLGFFLSAFTSQIFMLYGTIGICAGIGFGLMYLPAIVIVTSYFEKKRSFATGIAVCGSGIGTAIMSPLIEYIISLYGWKGAMLIISIILINCSIFGAMFKPLPTIPIPEINENESNDQQQQEESAPKSLLIQMNDAKNLSVQSSVEINVMKSEAETKSNINGDNYDDDNNIVKKRSHSFTPGFLIRDDSFYSGSLMNINNSSSTSSKSHHYNNQQFLKFQQNYKNRIDNNGGGDHNKNECCLFRRFNLPDEIKENLSEMIDLSLLKNCTFLIFSVSTFLTSVGFHVPFIFLKDWIVTNQIGSTNETGFFTSIIGLSSTISRLVFGYISDRSFINRFWLYIISITFCGIIIVANIFATTYELLVTFCSFFGLTCGTYVSLTSVVLVDLLGLEKLTNAFGLILLFQGIASILGPLFIGFIYDLSGAYDTGFLVIGILVTFSGLMLILIPICKNFKSIKKLFLY